MKLIIITDVHANLPAMQAAAGQFKAEGYDQIIHLGDAIAIGPQPRECLDLLLGLENIQFVMGNHDDWYAHGMPDPQPVWMSDGELVHQTWTHTQLGQHYRSTISAWPWQIEMQLGGIKLAFCHYALAPDRRSFKGILHDPQPADLDQLFKPQADLVFFGHVHVASDLLGQAHYLSPGSLGCQKMAVAPYLAVEIINGQVEILRRVIPYDDRPLYEAFKTRRVPERGFIYKAFFGNRFSPR
jgi:protein phosphatase